MTAKARKTLFLVLIVGLITSYSPLGQLSENPLSLPSNPSSKSAFEAWLSTDSDPDGSKADRFAEFESFLLENNVADVVPAWQLLRTDANYAERCNLPHFDIPPRGKWAAIVPTLRLVRDHVIPVVGRVEVNSSWRSEAVNACAKGAKGSRHLAFAAVDLIAPEQSDKRAMFETLCDMHWNEGAASGMGLGAYFDPAKPLSNIRGRFHIDASGFRSWGYDYSGTSSGCLLLEK